jgi:hypothetical protein
LWRIEQSLAVERATAGGFNAWWCGAFASLSFSARLVARIATQFR